MATQGDGVPEVLVLHYDDGVQEVLGLHYDDGVPPVLPDIFDILFGRRFHCMLF